MGCFGGSIQASMSASEVGNRADVNLDGRVDLHDAARLSEKWLLRQDLLREDLDRNGEVDGADIFYLGQNWLWQEFEQYIPSL